MNDSKIILATQAISLACTTVILTNKYKLAMSSQQIESLGGILSTAMIAVAIISHYQAKQGQVKRLLLGMLGMFAPLYAIIAGPTHYLFGFHAIALGVHAFVWKVLESKTRDKDK